MDKRDEIEKDIYSPERDFVDFNILIPCPQELEEQVVGSSQSSAVNLVKKYNKKLERGNNNGKRIFSRRF